MNVAQFRHRVRRLVGLSSQDLILTNSILNAYLYEAQVELVRRTVEQGFVPTHLRRRTTVDLNSGQVAYHLPESNLHLIRLRAQDAGGSWVDMRRATWEDMDELEGPDWENDPLSGTPAYYIPAGMERGVNSRGQLMVRIHPGPNYTMPNGLEFRYIHDPDTVDDMGTNSASDIIDTPVAFHDALAHYAAIRHLESQSELADENKMNLYRAVWERSVTQFIAVYGEASARRRVGTPLFPTVQVPTLSPTGPSTR